MTFYPIIPTKKSFLEIGYFSGNFRYSGQQKGYVMRKGRQETLFAVEEYKDVPKELVDIILNAADVIFMSAIEASCASLDGPKDSAHVKYMPIPNHMRFHIRKYTNGNYTLQNHK